MTSMSVNAKKIHKISNSKGDHQVDKYYMDNETNKIQIYKNNKLVDLEVDKDQQLSFYDTDGKRFRVNALTIKSNISFLQEVKRATEKDYQKQIDQLLETVKLLTKRIEVLESSKQIDQITEAGTVDESDYNYNLFVLNDPYSGKCSVQEAKEFLNNWVETHDMTEEQLQEIDNAMKPKPKVEDPEPQISSKRVVKKRQAIEPSDD